MSRLRLLGNKWFWLVFITITLIVFMVVTSQYGNKSNLAGSIVNVPLSPFQKFFSAMGNRAESAVTFFKDIKAVKQENERLRKQIDALENENRELKSYKRKNEELTELLKMKNQFNEFESLGANIIAKDPGNWFNTFKIDRGLKDGVNINSPVITRKGLVGRVFVSYPFSSKVISLIDVDTTVSGRVSRTRDLVRIRGDLLFKNKGLCVMDYITPDADISVGDTVETSGLGGLYPKGIMIGTILEIRKVGSEINRYAIIEPVVDLKRLEEVLVLNNIKK